MSIFSKNLGTLLIIYYLTKLLERYDTKLIICLLNSRRASPINKITLPKMI